MNAARRLIYVPLVVLLLGPLCPLSGLSVLGTEWEGGIRWIGVSQEDLPGSGSRLANELIVRLPLSLTDELSLAPSLSLTMLNYRLDSGRVVPTDPENRAFNALVPTLELPLRWRFLRFEGHSYAAGSGLAAELPVPIRIADSSATGSILSKHYSRGRFLLPFARMSGRWSLAGRFQVVSRLSVYFPVHRLWDGTDAPFYDHMMAGLTVGLFFPR